MSRSISAENFHGAKSGGGRATEGTGAVAASRLGQIVESIKTSGLK
ncbi:hypothetical protein [Streptomyces sp. NPDC052107]